MSGTLRAFEDFTPGETVEFHRVSVSAADITEFATAWDPQPMHLSEEAGRASMLGGLTGSGWHMICLMMRGMCEGFLLASTSAGSPGVDEVRWLKPLRPGDELTMYYTVVSTRTSKSRPDIGIVHFRHEVKNQDGETIMTCENPIMFGRRQSAGAAS
jgi:acyl dehydratase